MSRSRNPIGTLIAPAAGKFARNSAVLSLALVLAAGCQTVSKPADPPLQQADVTLHPSTVQFMESHCYKCHGSERQKGGLDFESEMAAGGFSDLDLLGKVVQLVSTGEMPPSKEPRPEATEIADLTGDLGRLRQAHLAAMKPDPGRVVSRRLNREEYNNTVRDLLGVDSRPADDFPADDTGYGFDTIGDVLSLSPMLAEKYLNVAEKIVGEALQQELENYATTPPEERHILSCSHRSETHSDRCARRIIRDLAQKAYRRPISAREAADLESFYELAIADGGDFEDGIGLALQAMLVSPNFLFRMEEDHSRKKSSAPYRLGAYEYASRLSYFLWSSMPDDALLAAARSGKLFKERTLREQIDRMLHDPRAMGLAENFGGQWLEIRNLDVIDPDPDEYPQFTDTLRLAMATETTLFFQSIMAEDRSILDFIDADYTYLNEPLAAHYGIEGIAGEAFQRVTVDTNQRGGILSHGSVLTVTSYPTRTSPVLRGLWVLDKILAAPPPPPPPDVPNLEDAKVDSTATLRARLEVHRENTSCAVCHDRIDPLGFGLENYDAIGRWRESENGQPVDNSGLLPDGRVFAGPSGLKAVLMDRKDEFARCLIKKMLTYALGRGLEAYDEPVVEELVTRVAQDEYRFSSLIYEIVNSLPFKNRRGETEVQ